MKELFPKTIDKLTKPTCEMKQIKHPTGKLCFYHGWNLTHNSRNCAAMKNDSKYTDDQKDFVIILPDHNLMVGNLKCNVQCAKGVKPK